MYTRVKLLHTMILKYFDISVYSILKRNSFNSIQKILGSNYRHLENGGLTDTTLKESKWFQRLHRSTARYSTSSYIAHCVIKFVNDLRQVGGFLRFPPQIKLTATI